MNNIYTITAIEDEHSKVSRCVGWFDNYEDAKKKGLQLDMSRGKPSAEQLDMSMGLLDVLNSTSDCKSENGTDCRNYGVLEGLWEARVLMADMMDAYRSSNKGYRDRPLLYDSSPINWNL